MFLHERLRWQWRLIDFEVKLNLMTMSVKSIGEWTDFCVQEKEAFGDVQAAKALSALKPKKPQAARRPRTAGHGRGRGRGRGGAKDMEGKETDGSSSETAASDVAGGDKAGDGAGEDPAADPMVPIPKLPRREAVTCTDGTLAGQISFACGLACLRHSRRSD